MSFQEIWNERFPPIYTQMRPPEHQCNSCNLTALCGKCPAWSDMEKGRLDARVEWSCEVGHRRAAKIGRWNGPLNQYAASIEQTEARGRGCEEREVLLPVLPS